VSEQFVELYNGPAKDILGGIIDGARQNDFKYEFSDNSFITKNGGSGNNSYTGANNNSGTDDDGTFAERDILPPAKDVIRIEVGTRLTNNSFNFGAEVILKD